MSIYIWRKHSNFFTSLVMYKLLIEIAVQNGKIWAESNLHSTVSWSLQWNDSVHTRCMQGAGGVWISNLKVTGSSKAPHPSYSLAAALPKFPEGTSRRDESLPKLMGWIKQQFRLLWINYSWFFLRAQAYISRWICSCVTPLSSEKANQHEACGCQIIIVKGCQACAETNHNRIIKWLVK